MSHAPNHNHHTSNRAHTDRPRQNQSQHQSGRSPIRLRTPGRTTVVVFAAFAVLQGAAVVMAASATLLLTVGNVALSCTAVAAVADRHRTGWSRRQLPSSRRIPTTLRMRDTTAGTDAASAWSSAVEDPERERAIAAVIELGRRRQSGELLALPRPTPIEPVRAQPAMDRAA